MRELTCQELVEGVTDYLEDALAADERQRFVSHLDFCLWCQTYTEQMRFTIALVARLGKVPLSETFEQQLLEQMRRLQTP